MGGFSILKSFAKAGLSRFSGVRSSRIAAAFGAHSVGNVVTLADRFLLVPVMLWFWGADVLGAWTIIRSVPAYLSISEMGFASAAGNTMTNAVIGENFALARSTYWSTKTLIGWITAAALLVTLPVVIFLPLSQIFNCQILSPEEFGLSVFLMAVYTISVFQTQLLYALARSVQRQVEVTLQIHITRIMEMVFAVVVMGCGGSVAHASVSYVVIRVAGIGLIDHWIRRRVSWLGDRERSDMSLLKSMIRPAAGFAVLPVTQSLQLQGVTMLLATVTTPAIVLAYNSMRTLARLPIMIGLSMSRTAWPEMSSAIAQGNSEMVRSLHYRTFWLSLMLNGVSLVLLTLLSGAVFSFWTNGKLNFDLATFVLLAIGAAVISFNTSNMSVLNASGKHGSSAIFWTVTAFISLLICFVMGDSLSPFNASAVLLVSEFFVAVFVASAAHAYFRQSDFKKS